MAERMSVTTDAHPRLFRLPAPVDRRLWRERGVYAEVVQHAVGLERQQIAGIALLCVVEHSAEKTNVRQREGRQACTGYVGGEETRDASAGDRAHCARAEREEKLPSCEVVAHRAFT